MSETPGNSGSDRPSHERSTPEPTGPPPEPDVSATAGAGVDPIHPGPSAPPGADVRPTRPSASADPGPSATPSASVDPTRSSASADSGSSAPPGAGVHPTNPGVSANNPGPSAPFRPPHVPSGPPRTPVLAAQPVPGLPNPAVISPIRLGPPAPTLWQRAWPRRDPAAGRGALYGSLATALIAAVSIPLDRPGLGWPIAGLGLLVPLALLLSRSGPPISGKRRTLGARAESLLWCAAALALLSVGFFRAAGWLFALSLLSAFGCVALAVGQHRRVPAVLVAPFTLVFAAFRAMPWARHGLVSDRLVSDGRVRDGRAAEAEGGAAPASATVLNPSAANPGAGTTRDSGTATRSDAETGAQGTSNTLRLLASIGIGMALLLVFGALFASADAAFGRVVSEIVPELDAGAMVRWLFVGVVAGVLALGAAFLVVNPSSIGDAAPRSGRPVRRIEWLVPVGALLVLFVLFVAVQLAVLFGDRDYVMRTVGLTFAEYARRGFWQLLVITLLTLCVMGVTVRKAPRDTAADRVLLRLVLGLLAVCSIVVVASALWRMNVYEQAYGFTRLRVFVSAVELWLGGLFILVMLAGATGLRRPATWLARAAVGLWVVTLLGLAALNPDRLIAAHNVDRAGAVQHASNSDIWYLRTLSADAAPELDRLPAGARECALSDIADDLARDEDDWRGWNLGRAVARQIITQPVIVQDYLCYRRY
ncbi:DUF4153 domain-containing protein [Dactylosporangium sp. NPDC051484]|uniref:DUF4153 domain-containing protein n=1 Tax=Dactylosporangium sp. NPDC051484 TaxID=3154942 RepID=UPI00344D260D